MIMIIIECVGILSFHLIHTDRHYVELGEHVFLTHLSHVCIPKIGIYIKQIIYDYPITLDYHYYYSYLSIIMIIFLLYTSSNFMLIFRAHSG